MGLFPKRRFPLFSRIRDDGKSPKKNPVILSVIHHRQNPLESNLVFFYISSILLPHELKGPMFQHDCSPFYISHLTFRLVALTDINSSIKPSVTTLNLRSDIWTTSLIGLSVTRLSLSGSRPSLPV
jgi:hypothetical protein